MQKQIMKKQLMEKQKGMTFISWVVVLVFVGFQFMMAIKVVPIFAEDHTIASFWKDLDNDLSLVGKSPKVIREAIVKKLKINNVYSIGMEDIEIRLADGYYIVTLNYEPRGTLIGKLEYVVSFEHEARIKATGN